MAKHLDLSDFNKTGPAFDDMPGVPDMNGMMDIFRQLNPRMVPDYFEAYTLLKLKQKLALVKFFLLFPFKLEKLHQG